MTMFHSSNNIIALRQTSCAQDLTEVCCSFPLCYEAKAMRLEPLHVFLADGSGPLDFLLVVRGKGVCLFVCMVQVVFCFLLRQE